MWIKKYFRQLRLSLIIVPALLVTFVSLFALLSVATDAAASSQPGDLLYQLKRPALDLKDTLTLNPEPPARIELTPESDGLTVVIDSGVIHGPQDGARIGSEDLNSNGAYNLNQSPEDKHESEAVGAIKEDLAHEKGDGVSREDSAESTDDINNNSSEESNHNHNGSDDSAESNHNDDSGHGNGEEDDNDGVNNDDNSGPGNGEGNDGDGVNNDGNSGPGNGEEDDNDRGDDDNSGPGNGEEDDNDRGDDDNSGHGNGEENDDDKGGSGSGDDDDKEKDKDDD